QIASIGGGALLTRLTLATKKWSKEDRPKILLGHTTSITTISHSRRRDYALALRSFRRRSLHSDASAAGSRLTAPRGPPAASAHRRHHRAAAFCACRSRAASSAAARRRKWRRAPPQAR